MVIDASVAIKWFLTDSQESDTDIAEEILTAFLADDLELHAPRVFTYECCHALTKACLTRMPITGSRLTRERAVRCVAELFQLPIRFSEASEAEGREALEMGVKHSKQHADMTYVRLAEFLDCQWCTADAKFLEALHASFPRNRVVVLSSLRRAS